MSSVITTSLSDSLPSSVPKLDATGINWAIFFVRFQDAVEAKGFWGHFDGSEPCPKLSDKSKPEEIAAKSQWEKDERSAKSLLTQKIPDSTLMRIFSKTAVKDRWDVIVKEYTEKGAYAQTELRTKFLESRCPDKGNIREFLEELRVKKEELAQVGVTIDEKDYLSTIISSLPYHLSNFASAQLSAAKMFAPTKSIEPDVLMSLLMEEAERQKAQLARRAFRKGKEEHDEALGVTDGSRPRKGKGRANITCWNCNKKGHYSNECEEPKKDDEPKGGSANTAAAAESDSESDFAWVVEEIEGEDWFDFEEAVAVTSDGSPEPDWFDEVDEGEEESDDEGGNSGGAVVDVFDRNVAPGVAIVSTEMGGTVFEDSRITGHVWPICDEHHDKILEGADRLSGAPVASFEGEYGGGGTTSESSGRMPDLDFFENPWIESPTMEWRNHTITEQTDELKTHPLDNHKGDENDPVAETNEGCHTKMSWPSKTIDVPEIDHVVCETNLSVPRFEGEEDIRVETMDLRVGYGSSFPIKSPTAEMFDPPDFTSKTLHKYIEKLSLSVINPSVDWAKFFEVEKSQGIIPDTCGGVLLPTVAEKVMMDAHGGVGLPMVGVSELVRPPECVVEGRWLLSRIELDRVSCDDRVASKSSWSRIDLRGSVGIPEANTPRDVFSRRQYASICCSPLASFILPTC